MSPNRREALERAGEAWARAVRPPKDVLPQYRFPEPDRYIGRFDTASEEKIRPGTIPGLNGRFDAKRFGRIKVI